jgi:hypothetical protein
VTREAGPLVGWEMCTCARFEGGWGVGGGVWRPPFVLLMQICVSKMGACACARVVLVRVSVHGGHVPSPGFKYPYRSWRVHPPGEPHRFRGFPGLLRRTRRWEHSRIKYRLRVTEGRIAAGPSQSTGSGPWRVCRGLSVI